MHNFLKKRKNNIVIYTAIFGDIDNLLEPKFKIPFCDLICFTDRDDLQSNNWEIRKMPGFYGNPLEDAKAFKIFPHFFLSEYEYSLWVDGRVWLKIEKFDELIRAVLAKKSWAMMKHEDRDTITEEVKQCIEWGKGNPDDLTRQLAAYTNEGFTDQVPLMVGTIIFRKHLEHEVVRINEAWWAEIRNYSKRDQISFPYVAWKNNFDFSILEWPVRKNKFFWTLSYKQREMFKSGQIDYLNKK
jgi:hypothetical protein